MGSFLNLLVNTSQSYFSFVKFMMRTNGVINYRDRRLCLAIQILLNLGFDLLIIQPLFSRFLIFTCCLIMNSQRRRRRSLRSKYVQIRSPNAKQRRPLSYISGGQRKLKSWVISWLFLNDSDLRHISCLSISPHSFPQRVSILIYILVFGLLNQLFYP